MPASNLMCNLKNSEIAVLILSTNDERYCNFISALKNSWLKKFQENGIQCFFYSGNAGQKTILDDRILLDCPDDLAHTSLKLREALGVLHEYLPNLKLVYRTNLSSYIDFDNFIKFIHTKNLNENTYLGLKGEAGYLSEFFYKNKVLHNLFKPLKLFKKIHFASGSGFFLGVNHLKKITSTSKYDRFIDDVMLGLIMNRKIAKSDEPLRFDLQEDNGHKISKSNYLRLVNKDLLFHYRFKTSNRHDDALFISQFNDPDFRLTTCTFDD
jgi:hypothetical protein